MFNIGLPEIIVVFAVVYILFGPKALVDLARTLGRAAARFQEGMNAVSEAFHDGANPEPRNIGADPAVPAENLNGQDVTHDRG